MEYNLNRYLNIERLEYKCEVITPMFLSGADTSKAEIRSASVKGALRFWWRALYNYKRFSGDDSADELAYMQDMENKIFGDTDNKSRVRILVDPISIVTNKDAFSHEYKGEEYSINGKNFKGDILKYLALGCATPKDKRDFIEPSSTFKIILEAPLTMKFGKGKKIIEIELFNELKKTMKAFSLFGGLGSKSRNGFGSIKISEKDKISKEIMNNSIAEFTHINKRIKVFRTIKKYQTWQDALSIIGLVYKSARDKLEVGERAKIALPIIAGKNTYDGRQPKPLFLRVTKSDKNEFSGRINCIPIYTDQQHLAVYEKFINSLSSQSNFIK